MAKLGLYPKTKDHTADPADLKEFDDKIASLKKYLSENTDNEGKPRVTGNDAKKAGDAVRSSIKDEAIPEIEKYLPDLAKHLGQSLKYGQTLIYSPNPTVKWVVR